ncbi:response regulator transcription factor [Nocardioides sp. R-C-SC26]|uniref:response regulator transcription factor n=1 Tax=Nocardioides sp. R-C-SC26 TaxID=2870414 RepID=UPI001E32BD23|nr:response regulator transcription factor [Nocardioides sp. R-C-SC26]
MSEQKTAVVAEDDVDVRELIQVVLSQSGFHVVVVEDGAAAIEAVRQYDPILTTLDVNMPGMDGFAVAKRLREFSQTYLIMITSLAQEVDIIRGFEAGADDYLVKPFRPRELRARADSMLRRAAAGMPGAAPAPAPAATEPEAEPESWAATAAREFQASIDGSPNRDSAREPYSPPPSAPVAPVAPPEPAPVFQPAPPQPAPVMPAPATTSVFGTGSPAGAASPAGPDAGAPGSLRFSDLSFDTGSGVATIGGRALDLTQAEADLLLSLMRTGRRVRSKADLVLVIRGQQYVTSYFVNEADKRAVEAHIASLRRKLGDDGPSARYIETVKGVGYRLAEAA